MIKLFFILLFGLLHSQNIDQRYHTTEEIYNYLDSLNNLEAINNWFHIDTIGFSTNDTIPILSVRISDNASLKEDEPRVLFIGQVHAEEILGVEIVMDLIDKLLFPKVNSYSHMQILKENIDIHLIPTLNPEGLNIVHDGYDVSFRKNKRDFSPDGPFPNGIFDYEPSIGNDNELTNSPLDLSLISLGFGLPVLGLIIVVPTTLKPNPKLKYLGVDL